MNISSSAETVFKLCVFLLVPVRTNVSISWFVNLSTVGGFFGWASINLTYIFFCKSIFRHSLIQVSQDTQTVE